MPADEQEVGLKVLVPALCIEPMFRKILGITGIFQLEKSDQRKDWPNNQGNVVFQFIFLHHPESPSKWKA